MLHNCDPSVCEIFSYMQALRYKVFIGFYTFYFNIFLFFSKNDNETWILLKGRGGLPGSSVPFDNAMGLLHFSEPLTKNADIQGTFIYPDWVTCVKVS